MCVGGGGGGGGSGWEGIEKGRREGALDLREGPDPVTLTPLPGHILLFANVDNN